MLQMIIISVVMGSDSLGGVVAIGGGRTFAIANGSVTLDCVAL